MPDLKLGLILPRADLPQADLREFFEGGVLPTPPTTYDATEGISTWGMLANGGPDGVGDCVVAGGGHLTMIDEAAAGNPVPSLTDDQAIAVYEQCAGYVPGEPQTDKGMLVEDFLSDWKEKPIFGQQLQTYAPVDLSKPGHLQVALWLFDGIDCGVLLPSDAMEQFQEGQPWTTGATGKPLGGHCIIGAKYDADSVTFVTWAALQQASLAWVQQALQEAWVVIPNEWTGLQKALDNGFRPDQLETFLKSI